MNMPGWAVDDDRGYWFALDTCTNRINARLLFSVEVALPRDLSATDQNRLAFAFAAKLATISAGLEGLAVPLTMAIHEGVKSDDQRTGRKPNPHLHIKLSTSVNDQVARPARQWFRRFNRLRPQLGGAPRSTVIGSRRWLRSVRELWAVVANHALMTAGLPKALDHRSHRSRGLDVLPTRHLGPRATELLRRGHLSSAARLNANIRSLNEAIFNARRARLAAQARLDSDAAEAAERQRRLRMEADDTLRALQRALEQSVLSGGAKDLLAASSMLLVTRDPASAAQGINTPDLDALHAAALEMAGPDWLVLRGPNRVFMCQAETAAVIMIAVGLMASDSTAAGVGAMAAKVAVRAGFGELQAVVTSEAVHIKEEVESIFDVAGVDCTWRMSKQASRRSVLR